MREIVSDIEKWVTNGSSIAMATVIETWGSAPRGIGSKMAMTFDGRIAGSVSGGCVEGAVFEVGSEVMESGQAQLVHFGVSDDTAWDVGLACGGSIDILVELLDMPIYEFQHGLLDEGELFATVTVISDIDDLMAKKMIIQRGGRQFGEIDPRLDGLIGAAARSALARGKSKRVAMDLPDVAPDPVEIFIEVVWPLPTLIIIGGVHIAIALATIAKTLSYETIVIDPRRAFGNLDRFPHVDRLIQAWPDDAFKEIKITPSTAVAILTHDPKIDDPALLAVLSSPAFYIGALGSRKTHASRRDRLIRAGISEMRLEQIHGPIGLDIGASTPEEIAVAIMAQIIAAHREA